MLPRQGGHADAALQTASPQAPVMAQPASPPQAPPQQAAGPPSSQQPSIPASHVHTQSSYSGSKQAAFHGKSASPAPPRFSCLLGSPAAGPGPEGGPVELLRAGPTTTHPGPQGSAMLTCRVPLAAMLTCRVSQQVCDTQVRSWTLIFVSRVSAVWTGSSTASYAPVGAQQNGRPHQHASHHCELSCSWTPVHVCLSTSPSGPVFTPLFSCRVSASRLSVLLSVCVQPSRFEDFCALL